MRRLKIGFFLDSWYPNVDGVVVDNLLKNMKKYADVTLVVPRMEKDYDDSNYPFKIIRVGLKIKRHMKQAKFQE